MKHLAIFLLAFITLSAYAQGQTTTSDFKRIQIGVNFSPDMSYRTLQNNNGSSFDTYRLDFRNESETVKFGYTTGLNVSFNLTRFIGLETGLQYSNKGYQTKYLEVNYKQPDPVSLEKFKYTYNFYYLDIPLKVNFTIGQKKLRLFTSIGVTTNILLEQTQTLISVYSDRTDRKIVPTDFDYNKINFSPTISLGLDYKINNFMNLRVEPTFRYGALKNNDGSITEQLYNAGLNIGYYIGL